MPDPEAEFWTIKDVAAHFGIKPQTIRVYRTQGKLPKEDNRFGTSPVWRPATIVAWTIPGPGRGHRTDLEGRPPRAAGPEGPKRRRPHAVPVQPHPPIVYYLRFADRIKIGTTKNLGSRLKVIPHDEVLATEPGDHELEHQRHEQFAHLRITGEWFESGPDLLAHISGLEVAAQEAS